VREGGSGPAYNSIVGSGVNGTVLHYHANSETLEDGDLIVIDAGARYTGYAADITRTFPVSGKFTKEQREQYELVLKAQRASIAACRPGATMAEINDATIKIFEKAGVRDHYPHGIGHHLGLEVHDIDPDEPLKAGAIVTIEPGLYFRESGSGVRIEDDILITKDGRRNLSSMIPKTVEEIESVMAAR
jgi:Xaa-Pro aminopeptidase